MQPPFDVLFQTVSVASIAAVLLWTFLSERKDTSKTIKALSVTMVTFQQMLLVQMLRGRMDGAPDTEDVRQTKIAVEELLRIVETQRAELEKVMVSK